MCKFAQLYACHELFLKSITQVKQTIQQMKQVIHTQSTIFLNKTSNLKMKD
jgi:hypothetical protein